MGLLHITNSFFAYMNDIAHQESFRGFLCGGAATGKGEADRG